MNIFVKKQTLQKNFELKINFEWFAKLKKLKILHVTNFNERHIRGLFYNTEELIMDLLD